MILNKRLFFISLFLILPIYLSAEEVPDWKDNLPIESGYVFYVGFGEGKTISDAKKEAENDLNQQFSGRIDMINNGESQYSYRARNSGEDDGIYSETTISDTTSSWISVRTIYPEIRKIFSTEDEGTYRYYVLGRMSESDIEKLREETKVWQQNEEQPYQIYKSLQALFKQVGKEKEFMAEIPASYATWLKDKCLVLKNPDDKKNSDWPGLFSDFLKKLFRNTISTNINIGDEPACVVYHYSYTERIKSTLKRNGIKCIHNGNVLNISPENERAFRYFVSTMKNPSRISLYVTQGYNIDSDIYSKSLDELLTKTFTDILTKKDRELKCEIRSEKFSQEDFARHDTRYAIVLELNFTYTKREKKYIDEKQMYNLNFGITAKFFDSVNPEKFLLIGKIEKSYLADSSKFKPKAPDKDFILTKAKDAVNFLSKTGGENNLTTLVDEFLKQI